MSELDLTEAILAAAVEGIEGAQRPGQHEMAAAVADFESEFGEITPEEMAAQARRDRERATVVRGQRRPSGRTATSP